MFVFGFIVAATLGCTAGSSRPHRRDVPAPGGDRALAPGPLPGPHPGRAGHRVAAAWPSASPSSARCASSPRPPSSTTTAPPFRPGCRSPASRTGPPTIPPTRCAPSGTTAQRRERRLRPRRPAHRQPDQEHPLGPERTQRRVRPLPMGRGSREVRHPVRHRPPSKRPPSRSPRRNTRATQSSSSIRPIP